MIVFRRLASARRPSRQRRVRGPPGRAADSRSGSAILRSCNAARRGSPARRGADRAAGRESASGSRDRGRVAGSSAAARACRGGAGAPKSSRAGARSTIRPAYITAIASRHAGDDAQVVRDQDDRRADLVAQLADQVEDLRLDRDVERGRRLVGDQQLGLAQRAPSRSSPAGACRRRTRADSGRCGCAASGMPTRSSISIERAARVGARRASRAARAPRSAGARRVRYGFSDVIGSWKIIAMRLPRSARMLALRAARSRSCPVEADRAAGDARRAAPARAAGSRGSSRSCREPLSPTMPSVSPALDVERHAVDGAHRHAFACGSRRAGRALAGAASAHRPLTRAAGADRARRAGRRRGS